MPRITIAGLGIEYELLGPAGAQAVALSPGGRLAMTVPGLRELAEKLAAGGRRVLIWDRPNCGASDLCFEGESEQVMQAEALLNLIMALELGPTAIGGGSAGARVSMIAAARGGAKISHLLQWWISGGTISAMMLGASYCCEPAIAAAMGGMAAVAALPAFSEQIARNPASREYILKQDPQKFIAAMERWAGAFAISPGLPLPGMTAADFARIAMPTLIFRGDEGDIYHPAEISDRVHRLIPHSTLIAPPWPRDAVQKRFLAAASNPAGLFLDWPLLAPAILEFTAKI